MKKNTATIMVKKEADTKILKRESKIEAWIVAWEYKMQGFKVEVVDDETCKTIYC